MTKILSGLIKSRLLRSRSSTAGPKPESFRSKEVLYGHFAPGLYSLIFQTGLSSRRREEGPQQTLKPRQQLSPGSGFAKVAGPIGPRTLTLAAGTVTPVRLNDEINTRTAQAGDPFHGTTASDIKFTAFTAIPAGTPMTGRSVETKAAGRLAGAAMLGVELVSVRLPNGTETPRMFLW